MISKTLAPQSIALIGASKTPGKLGYDILSNIVHLGFTGEIFPINPKGGEMFGKKVYENVSLLPKAVDVAVIAVPAKFVCAVAIECGKKGISGIVVISAGFKEVSKEGAEEEKKLAKICEKYNMTLIGPNCLGIINTDISLNASFAEGMPPKGNISLLSQSGAMAVAILDWASKSGLGFSKVISMGNKAGTSENEFLEFLLEDKTTDVILLYLESIADGKKLMEIAKKNNGKKPIIIVKSGRSEAGTKAISSHTGSLAGSDAAVEAAFKQVGIIRAMDTEELFNYAKVFSSYVPFFHACSAKQSFQNSQKKNKKDTQKEERNLSQLSGRVAIITNAGGPGILATDALSETKLTLAQFSAETEEKLAEGLPAAAALHNPVDVIGDASATRYEYALKTVLADKNVDSVLVLLTPQVMTEPKKVASITVAMTHEYLCKPVVAAFMGGENVEEGKRIFKRHHLPVYEFPKNAVLALEKLRWHRQMQNVNFLPDKGETRGGILERETLSNSSRHGEGEKSHAQKIILSSAPQEKIHTEKAFELFEIYGIPAPKVQLATTKQEAKKIAQKEGFPIVLKIASPDVFHKTDVGGIRIDLQTEVDVEKAFSDIMETVQKNMPAARLRGVTVERMMPMGKEVIIGATKDPQFGHLLMFGLGGIYVEVLKDVSFRIAPVNHTQAKKMISEIASLKILTGVRGESPVDIDAIADVIVKIGQMVTDFPEISEIEINPLIAGLKTGVRAVDAKIVL